MRISFVLDTFGGGGKERRCLQLIQGLNSQGYCDIQVIIINDTVDYPELYETQSDIIIVDRKKKNLNLLSTLEEVKCCFKTFNPEIVQTWGGISTLIPVILKPLFHYKIVGAYVANSNRIGIFSLMNILQLFCEKIVGNSIEGLKAYRISKKRSALIYNGFNEKRFEARIDRKEEKKKLGIQTPFVVAMIASFWWHKDWCCFIKAAKKICKVRKDITFLAIGAGPLWESMNKLVDHDERDFIRMLGQRNDIDEIIQVCDLTVLVSNHGEGVSNSILESMAFGVPVIATNSGGTPEIIEDGKNGILLSENKEDDLVEMVCRIIDDETTRTIYGKNSAELVRSRFLLSKMTKSYIKLYLGLLNK